MLFRCVLFNTYCLDMRPQKLRCQPCPYRAFCACPCLPVAVFICLRLVRLALRSGSTLHIKRPPVLVTSGLGEQFQAV